LLDSIYTGGEVYLSAHEDGTDSVPKRRHIKFRRQGIIQKTAYNNNRLVCLFLLWQHKQLHCGSVEVTIVKTLIRCHASDLNNSYDFSQIQHPSQKE